MPIFERLLPVMTGQCESAGIERRPNPEVRDNRKLGHADLPLSLRVDEESTVNKGMGSKLRLKKLLTDFRERRKLAIVLL
jgi:hypothetical protein